MSDTDPTLDIFPDDLRQNEEDMLSDLSGDLRVLNKSVADTRYRDIVFGKTFVKFGNIASAKVTSRKLSFTLRYEAGSEDQCAKIYLENSSLLKALPESMKVYDSVNYCLRPYRSTEGTNFVYMVTLLTKVHSAQGAETVLTPEGA